MDTGLLLGLAIGAVVGVLAGWLLASSRLRAVPLRLQRGPCPCTRTVPKSGCSRPVAIDSVVVFPAPLGPTSP